MIDILGKISDLSVLTYVVSSMLAVGLSQPLEKVILPLKNPRIVALALALNFIAAPALAWFLSRLIPLQPAHAIGLLLLGGAAGAPFIPRLAEAAGASIANAVAMMVLLMIGSIVFIPFAMPVIIPGLSASPLGIAMPLLITMLLPLLLGFTINARYHEASKRLLPAFTKLANLTFVLMLLLLVGLNIQALLDTLGSFAIGTYALFIGLMVAMGYAAGGSEYRTRAGFALACGQRNISAALVVAVDSFDDREIVVMVLVGAIVGLFMLLGTGRLLRRLQPGIN